MPAHGVSSTAVTDPRSTQEIVTGRQGHEVRCVADDQCSTGQRPPSGTSEHCWCRAGTYIHAADAPGLRGSTRTELAVRASVWSSRLRRACGGDTGPVHAAWTHVGRLWSNGEPLLAV